MIIGIGNDIINIQRIGKVLNLYGKRFTNRIFTEAERKKSELRKDKESSYAKLFAAKEACSKALNTGISEGIRWKDLEVISLSNGKPIMELKGKALSFLEHLLPKNHDALIHMTISDDFPWVQAVVIIEALLH